MVSTMTGCAFTMGQPWKGVFAAMGEHHHGGGRSRGRRSRHGFGPWMMFGGPPWAGRDPWGGPWFGAPGGPRGPRGPRARRGDVRAAILAVLAERPANGYQIIQEITERSGGVWRPSPGSIYPTLQQLQDEGLVTADDSGGRRSFRLTEEGREYVESHADEVAAPWEAMTAAEDEDEHDLKPLIGQAAAALWQILATGSLDQQARAREVLADTRRRLYGILAEGDDQDPLDDLDGEA